MTDPKVTAEERVGRICAFLDEHNIGMTDAQWDLFKAEIVEALTLAAQEASGR